MKQFMQKEIHQCKFRLVDTTHGTVVVPDFVDTGYNLEPYCEGKIQEVGEWRDGWVGRMSAPGYMDCTEWVYGETKELVDGMLDDLYGDPDDMQEGEGK